MNSCEAMSRFVPPLAYEPGDLGFLWGELVGGAWAALAGTLAGGAQFGPGAFGEGFHAEPVEHLAGGAELVGGVAAAQPLPVQQVEAGQFRDELALLQMLDGQPVLGFGVVVAGQQRPAAGQPSQASAPPRAGSLVPVRLRRPTPTSA